MQNDLKEQLANELYDRFIKYSRKFCSAEALNNERMNSHYRTWSIRMIAHLMIEIADLKEQIKCQTKTS